MDYQYVVHISHIMAYVQAFLAVMVKIVKQ